MSYVAGVDTEKTRTTRSSRSTAEGRVDKKSYIYLNGTTLDYCHAGADGRLHVVNPSAKSSCGCGTSFSA